MSARAGEERPRLFVGYFRVSTAKQGKSGLGLEGQRLAVLKYLGANRPARMIAEFTEVESGRKSDLERPQLRAALSLCRRKKATLLVARIDRLGRNLALIARLMESTVGFAAADLPVMDPLTVHIIAAVAEYEADLIAARRRAAMAAMKAQGRKIGTAASTPEERAAMLEKANAALVQSRMDHARRTMPHILELRRKGIAGYKSAATALTAAGVPTFTGKGRWYGCTVKAIVTAIEPDFQVQRPRMSDWHKRKLIGATVHSNITGADARAATLAPVIAEIEAAGVRSLLGISRELTRRGIPTARGKVTWGVYAVQLIRERLVRLANSSARTGSVPIHDDTARADLAPCQLEPVGAIAEIPATPTRRSTPPRGRGGAAHRT